MNEYDVITIESNSIVNKQSKTLSKIEVIVFVKLNILSKRYFLIYLFNTFINKFIYTIFFNIKSDYRVYKDNKFYI